MFCGILRKLYHILFSESNPPFLTAQKILHTVYKFTETPFNFGDFVNRPSPFRPPLCAKAFSLIRQEDRPLKLRERRVRLISWKAKRWEAILETNHITHAKFATSAKSAKSFICCLPLFLFCLLERVRQNWWQNLSAIKNIFTYRFNIHIYPS